MVDAPTPIVIEGVAEVIPVGILHAVRVKLPKDIDESPFHGVAVGLAGVSVEIGIVDAAVGVVDVDGLRGDIQIAQPNGRLRRRRRAANWGKPLRLRMFR